MGGLRPAGALCPAARPQHGLGQLGNHPQPVGVGQRGGPSHAGLHGQVSEPRAAAHQRLQPQHALFRRHRAAVLRSDRQRGTEHSGQLLQPQRTPQRRPAAGSGHGKDTGRRAEAGPALGRGAWHTRPHPEETLADLHLHRQLALQSGRLRGRQLQAGGPGGAHARGHCVEKRQPAAQRPGEGRRHHRRQGTGCGAGHRGVDEGQQAEHLRHASLENLRRGPASRGIQPAHGAGIQREQQLLEPRRALCRTPRHALCHHHGLACRGSLPAGVSGCALTLL